MSFDTEQEFIQNSIKKSKKAKHTDLKPEKYCHTCFNDVTGDMLFCNDICAKEYDLIRKFQQ